MILRDDLFRTSESTCFRLSNDEFDLNTEQLMGHVVIKSFGNGWLLTLSLRNVSLRDKDVKSMFLLSEKYASMLVPVSAILKSSV